MSRSDRDKLNRIRELMDPDAMGLKGMTPLDPHDPASVERWAAAIAIRTARIREVLGVPDKRSIDGLRPRHVIMDEVQLMFPARDEQHKGRILRGPLPDVTTIHHAFRVPAGDEPILPVSESEPILRLSTNRKKFKKGTQ